MKKVYIEPTARCNLRCTMCFRHQWIDEEQGTMDADTIRSLLDTLRDPAVETVLFGGMGEPLVHPQTIHMIGTLAAMGKRVELLTNGTLLTEETLDRLLQGGLHMLWVSMDGFTREAYGAMRLGSRFDQICANLAEFDRRRSGTGTQLGITFVMTPDNRAEWRHMNDFADRFHADLLNLSHVIPGSPMPREVSLYDEDLPTGKMKRIASPFEKHPHNHCVFVSEECTFIRWNGDVAPCMPLLHSARTYMFDLERTVYRHAFGNIRHQSLHAIWASAEYRAFRDRVNAFYFPNCTGCLGCDLRLDNRIDCLYNDTPTCGACLWSTGKVFCP